MQQMVEQARSWPFQEARVLIKHINLKGKRHGFEPLRLWFQALYEVILGDSNGPRFGAFTAAYGVNETVKLLRSAVEEHQDVVA